MLVVPLHKVLKLSDLSDEETTDMFLVIQRIQNAFEKYYNTSANNIFIKEGCEVSPLINMFSIS